MEELVPHMPWLDQASQQVTFERRRFKSTLVSLGVGFFNLGTAALVDASSWRSGQVVLIVAIGLALIASSVQFLWPQRWIFIARIGLHLVSLLPMITLGSDLVGLNGLLQGTLSRVIFGGVAGGLHSLGAQQAFFGWIATRRYQRTPQAAPLLVLVDALQRALRQTSARRDPQIIEFNCREGRSTYRWRARLDAGRVVLLNRETDLILLLEPQELEIIPDGPLHLKRHRATITIDQIARRGTIRPAELARFQTWQALQPKPAPGPLRVPAAR